MSFLHGPKAGRCARPFQFGDLATLLLRYLYIQVFMRHNDYPQTAHIGALHVQVLPYVLRMHRIYVTQCNAMLPACTLTELQGTQANSSQAAAVPRNTPQLLSRMHLKFCNAQPSVGILATLAPWASHEFWDTIIPLCLACLPCGAESTPPVPDVFLACSGIGTVIATTHDNNATLFMYSTQTFHSDSLSPTSTSWT